MILDEFAQLGYMEDISEGMVTLRDAKIKIWPFFQHIGQLKQVYPKDWGNFVNSSNVQILGLTMTDKDSKEWLSQVMGTHVVETEDGKQIEKPLLSPDQIGNRLKLDSPYQIDLPVGSGSPLMLEKCSFKPIKSYEEFFPGILDRHVKEN